MIDGSPQSVSSQDSFCFLQDEEPPFDLLAEPADHAEGNCAMRFKPSPAETVFIWPKNGTRAGVGVHVDDCLVLVMDRSLKRVKEMKAMVGQRWPVKDKGEVKEYCMMAINRDFDRY